jgi:hypothetical protein
MYRRYAILFSIQLYFMIMMAVLMSINWPTNDYSIEDILNANQQQQGNWQPSGTEWELKIVSEGDLVNLN